VKCCFCGILQDISLSLSLDEITVECGFENRRRVASEGLVNDEFFLGWSHNKGDKILQVPIYQSVSKITSENDI
jgi:hypothetical protein